MKPEIKAAWVAALRSGEYEQGDGNLQKEGKFCCLGVLCEIAVKQFDLDIDVRAEGLYSEDDSTVVTLYNEQSAFLPSAVQDWAGMDDNGGYFDQPVHVLDGEIVTPTPAMWGQYGPTEVRTLYLLNDGGVSFDAIANVIEEKF